jgi:hypothetical protein
MIFSLKMNLRMMNNLKENHFSLGKRASTDILEKKDTLGKYVYLVSLG